MRESLPGLALLITYWLVGVFRAVRPSPRPRNLGRVGPEVESSASSPYGPIVESSAGSPSPLPFIILSVRASKKLLNSIGYAFTWPRARILP